MKQVYPRLKRSQPFPFPLEDCSFPRSGLSDLATLGLTTVRSRKRKVLSRKRKLSLDLFHLGIYLFPALQNIYLFLQFYFKSISHGAIYYCKNNQRTIKKNHSRKMSKICIGVVARKMHYINMSKIS